MSDEYITTDHAYDTLHQLRCSVDDLTAICTDIGRISKSRSLKIQGKALNAPKTHELLSACIFDFIEYCTHLSQGDDNDRDDLSRKLASRIIEEYAK